MLSLFDPESCRCLFAILETRVAGSYLEAIRFWRLGDSTGLATFINCFVELAQRSTGTLFRTEKPSSHE